MVIRRVGAVLRSSKYDNSRPSQKGCSEAIYACFRPKESHFHDSDLGHNGGRYKVLG